MIYNSHSNYPHTYQNIYQPHQYSQVNPQNNYFQTTSINTNTNMSIHNYNQQSSQSITNDFISLKLKFKNRLRIFEDITSKSNGDYDNEFLRIKPFSLKEIKLNKDKLYIECHKKYDENESETAEGSERSSKNDEKVSFKEETTKISKLRMLFSES